MRYARRHQGQEYTRLQEEAGPGEVDPLAGAVATLTRFRATGLTARIAGLERAVAGSSGPDVAGMLVREEIGTATLGAALLIKELAGEINVLIHTVGILTALPYILEAGERIEYVSLGAGNTGRRHDLETDRRVAEFKFTAWRGGPEPIRQNTLFLDLFNLASAPTTKRRVLYVIDKTLPLRFLENRRALASVLSTNRGAADRFRALHGERFRTVREYYESVRDHVEIVDLATRIPDLGWRSANVGSHDIGGSRPIASRRGVSHERAPIRAGGGKYAPLQAYLRARKGPVDLTFAEIDGLVGGLPSSARTYREWWANSAHNLQARSWLEADRRVDGVDLPAEHVRFS